MQQRSFGENLGIKVVSLEQGSCRAELEIQRGHLNSLGVAHGGVLTALADVTMGNACRSICDKKVVTVELKLSFMRPVLKGSVVAEARALKKGEHLIFANCTIFNEKGLEAAIALGTYMMIDELKI